MPSLLILWQRTPSCPRIRLCPLGAPAPASLPTFSLLFRERLLRTPRAGVHAHPWAPAALPTAFEGAAYLSELPPDGRHGPQSHIETCKYTISCPPGGGWTRDSWPASRSQAIPCVLERYLYSSCGVPWSRLAVTKNCLPLQLTDEQGGSGRREGDHRRGVAGCTRAQTRHGQLALPVLSAYGEGKTGEKGIQMPLPVRMCVCECV